MLGCALEVSLPRGISASHRSKDSRHVAHPEYARHWFDRLCGAKPICPDRLTVPVAPLMFGLENDWVETVMHAAPTFW